jgi:apyrase
MRQTPFQLFGLWTIVVVDYVNIPVGRRRIAQIDPFITWSAESTRGLLLIAVVICFRIFSCPHAHHFHDLCDYPHIFRRIRMAYFLWLLGLFTLSAHSKNSNPWFYSAVIDAGSKGSRLVIFRWQPETTLPRKRIQIPETVGMKSVNPGLAASALDPPSVKGPLKELIDFAVETLKPLSVAFGSIPLYLKATAGMRDLIPAARDGVMIETIRFLANYSPFLFDSTHALVISGEEEGAYAWLSINALKGVLGSDRGESSFGIIDLGGASIQISFVPEANHYVLQNCYPITLTDESTYRLYAKSYLHYGIVEANRRLASNIITENILKVDSVSEIHNPCYYQGLEFSPDFATRKYKIPIAVTMTGTGDFSRCSDELKNLFNKANVECWVRDCTFDGVYQPRLDSRPFVGIGNIGKLLQVAGVPEKASLKSVRDVGARICAMSYDQVAIEFSILSNKMRKNLCFSLSYIYTLLTYGLGFTISDVSDLTGRPSQIEFNNFIGTTKVDWALGAMIWEANQQPPQSIPEYLKLVENLETSHIKPVGGDIETPKPRAEWMDELPDLKMLVPEKVLESV